MVNFFNKLEIEIHRIIEEQQEFNRERNRIFAIFGHFLQQIRNRDTSDKRRTPFLRFNPQKMTF